MIAFLVAFLFACNLLLASNVWAKTPFTIEEAALGTLTVQSFSGQWISDFELEYKDKETKDVKLFNVNTNETLIRLRASVLTPYGGTKCKFSPDGKYALVPYNVTPVYRHTTKARYVVYSIQNGKYYHVANNKTLQLAEWGPKNNTLIYVKDNNLFVVREIDENMKGVQITTSGVPGVVYNGLSDWVYEEEVLSSDAAYWFSPSGNQLLYLTLNDSRVHETTYLRYGEPGTLNDQYPRTMKIRYPKSGSAPPQFSLWHVSLNNLSNKTLFARSNKDVFYNLKWADDQVFFYLVTNRVQNQSRTYSCNAKNPKTCVVTFRNDNKKGWANTHMPEISSEMNRFLKLEGVPVGEFGKFTHLVLHYANGTTKQLTTGLYEVEQVLFWDEKKKIVYYSAPEELRSTTLHVYAVSEMADQPVCLTCNVKSVENLRCDSVTASFSKKGSFAVVNCNGLQPKTVYLYKTEIPFGRPLRLLEDNAKLRAALKEKQLPDVYNFMAKIPGQIHADVRLYVPPNIDKVGFSKYPMIVYVYGGPESKAISDVFKLDYGLYVATNLSVIYAVIDGRNTLKKGENVLFAGYRALGTVEIEDQMDITKQIADFFPFVDPDRIGVWGWSYGGYATTKILETDKWNMFKCGIAVAPVTDWLYYDSIYTERYMSTPLDNKAGYKNATTLKNVSKLKEKQFFLIHGSADDNVHYQNSMMLARVLEKNNVPFNMMSYPDENHSILNTRKHLYYTMSKFWTQCFQI